ncbi:MAG TPA: NlpC/P60 family protein [Geobacter sp.]|nr:NlpC/P60 family protein [Geobacter sp.]
MSINPLQGFAPSSAPSEACVGKKSNTGGSAFDSLLKSLQPGDDKAAPKVQQAEAELLRIKMLQSTLSLFGVPEQSPASGMQALESLLSGLTGNSGKPAAQACGLPAPWHSEAAGETSAAFSPAPAADVEGIEETAAHFLGTPYRFGGDGATGIDCSSFVQQVFRENRIELPRTAREQINIGTDVPAGELRKGDLVFFQTYASYPSHVGIYLGDGKMIHASSGKGEVTISDINSDYYRPRYLGAKRVV